jgi:hypothetical protein
MSVDSLLVGAQHAAPLLCKTQTQALTEVVGYLKNNLISAVILSEATEGSGLAGNDLNPSTL